MNAEWVLALVGAATVALLLQVNSRVWGCLPDDPPGGRKRHARPLPMVGIALGVLATVYLGLSASSWVTTGAALCALLGYFDDRRKEHGGGVPVVIKVAVLAEV